MTQSLNDESRKHIEQVAGEALAQLESIADTAKSKLHDGRALGSDALASINTCLLYTSLAPELLATQALHSAKVTGKGAPKSTLKKIYDFQELLTLFSPRSKEKAIVLPNEPVEIDLLIGTDCISEGQNLQDCDYLINYDIHWNPCLLYTSRCV